MNKLLKNNKGFVRELGTLPTVLILLVVAALVGSLGLQLLGDQKADLTANTYEYNATTEGQQGISEITGKMDTIGLTVAIVIVLSIIIGVFAYVRTR